MKLFIFFKKIKVISLNKMYLFLLIFFIFVIFIYPSLKKSKFEIQKDTFEKIHPASI